MKKPAPTTDDEWDDAIADEVVKQIIDTPDADVLVSKWPPLVQSAATSDERWHYYLRCADSRVLARKG